MTSEEISNAIETRLRNITRAGMEELIEYMKAAGFFEAPASGSYHLAKPGGLAEHSYNVMQTGLKLNEALGNPCSNESVILVCLLHDLGKAGQFYERYYVENYLKSGKISASKPYTINKNLRTLPHEIVSVVEASKYIDLTPAEQWAIAYHNGLYGDFKYEIQGKEDALYLILHSADMWSARVIEVESEAESE